MFKIIKGLYASFTIFITKDGDSIDLNDGNWDLDFTLRENTETGKVVPGAVITPSDIGYFIEFSDTVTSTLNPRLVGYVMVIKITAKDKRTQMRDVVKVIVEE